jgi:hypothetical protein
MAPKSDAKITTALERHNSVALMNNAGGRGAAFDAILAFLNRCPLSFALSGSPTLHQRHIREFWNSAVHDTEAEPPCLRVRVANCAFSVSEETIRGVLQIRDDPTAGDLFSDTLIAGSFRRMGYSGRLSPVQYKKSEMPTQYRFLMHTLIQCLSPWKGGYDVMDRRGQSMMVALVFNRPYNFSRYIFGGMTANLLERKGKLQSVPKERFLQYPRFVQLLINHALPNTPYDGPTMNVFKMDPRIFKDCKSNLPAQPLLGALTDPNFPPPAENAFDDLIAPDPPAQRRPRGSKRPKKYKGVAIEESSEEEEAEEESEEEEEDEEDHGEELGEENVTASVKAELELLKGFKNHLTPEVYKTKEAEIIKRAATKFADVITSGFEAFDKRKGKRPMGESGSRRSTRSVRSKRAANVSVQPAPLSPHRTSPTSPPTHTTATIPLPPPPPPPPSPKRKSRSDAGEEEDSPPPPPLKRTKITIKPPTPSSSTPILSVPPPITSTRPPPAYHHLQQQPPQPHPHSSRPPPVTTTISTSSIPIPTPTFRASTPVSAPKQTASVSVPLQTGSSSVRTPRAPTVPDLIRALNDKVTQLINENSEYKARIESLEKDNTSLKSRVKKLEGTAGPNIQLQEDFNILKTKFDSFMEAKAAKAAKAAQKAKDDAEVAQLFIDAEDKEENEEDKENKDDDADLPSDKDGKDDKPDDDNLGGAGAAIQSSAPVAESSDKHVDQPESKGESASGSHIADQPSQQDAADTEGMTADPNPEQRLIVYTGTRSQAIVQIIPETTPSSTQSLSDYAPGEAYAVFKDFGEGSANVDTIICDYLPDADFDFESDTEQEDPNQGLHLTFCESLPEDLTEPIAPVSSPESIDDDEVETSIPIPTSTPSAIPEVPDVPKVCTHFRVPNSRLKGRIISWKYEPSRQVFAIKRYDGVQYFDIHLRSLGSLPAHDLKHLVQLRLHDPDHSKEAQTVLRIMKKEFFGEEPYKWFKPNTGKRRKLKLIDPSTGKKTVKVIYKDPLCLKYAPLVPLPQDCLENMERWFYDDLKGEAVMVAKDKSELLRVLDPYQMMGLSRKDIRILSRREMEYNQSERLQALRFVNFIARLRRGHGHSQDHSTFNPQQVAGPHSLHAYGQLGMPDHQ